MELLLNPAGRRTVFILAVGILASLSVLMFRPALYSSAHIHTADAGSAARPATVVRPLSCEKLTDIPGKAVTTALVTFPPNAYSPAHRHPGSVTAYVTKGTIRSQLAGGAAVIYRVGETWFEPTGTLHLFAENASATEPAEILAVFVADEDCGPLVIPEK